MKRNPVVSNEITYAKLPGIYAAIKRSKECLYILLWNNLQGILWEKKDGEQRIYNTIFCIRKYTFPYFYEKLIKDIGNE